MNDIRTSYTAGSQVYAQVRKASDLTYYHTGTTTLEAYNAANWTAYAITMTEIGSTGEYAASFPTAISAAGIYDVILYARAGASPATSDTKIGGGILLWDGSAELNLSTLDAEVAALGQGEVNIISSSPVAQDLSVTIFRGDDYYAADSRPLVWTTSDASTWPTLTGATITFTAKLSPVNENPGTATVTASGSVITATGANKSVRVELPTASTAGMAVGKHGYTYDVQATLTNGHKVTLASGTLTVREDYTS
jgi:hypothetical protein